MQNHTGEQSIEERGKEVVHETLVLEKCSPVVTGIADRQTAICVKRKDGEVCDGGKGLVSRG